MADSGIGDIGGIIAGANPFGGAIEAASGVVQGITTAITGAQQMKRAQELRDQANQVQTEQIRPEYLTAEKNAQQQSLYGLPALNAYQSQLGKNIAGSVRAIKESSPNGGATLAAIDGALSSGNDAENDLSAKDAQAQENKSQEANNIVWNVGDKQRQLENIRDKQKLALQTQAGNLETASTINKQQGINSALGGISQGASQAFKMDNSPNTTSTVNPYGANATPSPYSGTDNTNLSGSGNTITTTPSSNNYNFNAWTPYSLGN